MRPYVLNGFMYSLIRLYEYWKLTRSEKALELFNKGIRALKLMIHKFDLEYWTAYDLLGTIARLPKHELHIRFSKKLYEITGDELFKKYHIKWSGYIFTPYGLRELISWHALKLFRELLVLDTMSKFLVNLAMAFFVYIVIRYLIKAVKLTLRLIY